MAAPLPFAESERRLLENLLKREARFMVVGLSTATLQGAPVVTQDVNRAEDRLTIPGLRDALAATQTPKRRVKKK